jgi:hypothetical protein
VNDSTLTRHQPIATTETAVSVAISGAAITSAPVARDLFGQLESRTLEAITQANNVFKATMPAFDYATRNPVDSSRNEPDNG